MLPHTFACVLIGWIVEQMHQPVRVLPVVEIILAKIYSVRDVDLIHSPRTERDMLKGVKDACGCQQHRRADRFADNQKLPAVLLFEQMRLAQLSRYIMQQTFGICRCLADAVRLIGRAKFLC